MGGRGGVRGLTEEEELQAEEHVEGYIVGFCLGEEEEGGEVEECYSKVCHELASVNDFYGRNYIPPLPSRPLFALVLLLCHSVKAIQPPLKAIPPKTICARPTRSSASKESIIPPDRP